MFVDSGAYLALLDRTERRHVEATATVRSLARERYRQYTTKVLLIEAHALILSRLGIAVAARFLQSTTLTHTTVIRVRAADEERAKHILFQYADKPFSFADAISFVVMERLRISHAFTFDRHFAQYGFTVLTANLL